MIQKPQVGLHSFEPWQNDCKTSIADIGSSINETSNEEEAHPNVSSGHHDHLEMMETANDKEKCELELSQHNKQKENTIFI
jgi:hypothetical protein